MMVIMPIEGILFEGTDIRTALPSQAGRALFDSLSANYGFTLLTSNPKPLVDGWLTQQGIRQFGIVYNYNDQGLGLTLNQWKAHMVRQQLADSNPVAWFIDTDPEAVQMAFLEGVPTLLMSHPRYTRPEFRPGEKKVRLWSDLTGTIEHERTLGGQ